MLPRPCWRKRIEDAWEVRSVIWLSGVRRVGKTTLCRALTNVDYLDCEMPRIRRDMEDPEGFLDSSKNRAATARPASQ